MNNAVGSDRKRPIRLKRKPRMIIKRIPLVLLVVAVVLMIASALVPTTRWVHASGYVMTRDQAKIRSSVEGVIAERFVSSGETIKKGQLLFQLHDTVERTSYEEAMSRIEVEKAELERLLSRQELEVLLRDEQVKQANLALKVALNKLRRMEDVDAGSSLFSKSQVEDAQLEVDLAHSRVSELELPREPVMERQVKVYRERIVATSKQLARLEAEVSLRKIYAPMDGRIHLHRYESGEVVKPEDELGQIFDDTSWIVRLKVPERYLSYVKVDQPVQVALSAYPTLRHGYQEARLSRVEQLIVPNRTGDGFIYVEAAFEGDTVLHPGMTAWADINSGSTSILYRLLGL